MCSGAQKLKAEGNNSFKLKNFPDAIRKYTGTLDILNQLDGEPNASALFAISLSA